MDARDLLRRYLEQRRELGESELVLDGMTVEDVMRLLGATSLSAQAGGERRSAPAAAEGRSVRELAGDQSDDWRTALQDAGVTSDAKTSGPSGTSTPPETKAAIRSAPIPRMAFPPEPIGPTTVGESTNEIASRKEIFAPRGIVVPRIEDQLMPDAIEKLDSLDAVSKQVKKCTRCSLYKTATNPVPGEGDPQRGSRLCRRSPRCEGRRNGPAVRRPGWSATHKDSRGDRSDARAGIHLQRAQASAAG